MSITKTWIYIQQEGDASRGTTYEENGSPESIQATSLQSYTNYRASAGCISDGLQCLSLQSVAFQTLRLNNLSATFNAVRRQGLNTQLEGGYIVYYDYVSLYALSSAILYVSQNGVQVGQYQGTADYNTSQITFGIPAGEWVCCGEIYDLHVTVIDIFGQSYTSVVTTITTDTLNLVTMTYDSSTTSSVTFDLDYWLDSGFASGWLDVWNEGDDPSTDQPQSHFYFLDGDTSVTASGLDEGTTYIFRVTVTLDDGQGTEIYTAYLNASTAIQGLDTCFYIESTHNSSMTIDITPSGSPNYSPSLQKSSDGINWTEITISTSSSTSIEIPAMGKVYLKGDNPQGFNRSNSAYYCIGSNYSHIIGGNILSLVDSTDFTSLSRVPDYSFCGLFNRDIGLFDSSDVNFGTATTSGQHSCQSMFANCNNMTGGPRLYDFTDLESSAFAYMFSGCTSLAVPSDMSRINVGEWAISGTYDGCTSITSTASMIPLTAGSYSFYNTYRNCTGITTAANIDFRSTVLDSGGAGACASMFYGCSGLVTPPSHLPSTQNGEGNYNNMFRECSSLQSTPSASNVRVFYGPGACDYMFYGCSSLTTGMDIRHITPGVSTQYNLRSMYQNCRSLRAAYAYNTTYGWRYDGISSQARNWITFVATGGTVYAPNASVAAEIPLNSNDGCPSGWSVVTQAP